MGIFLQFSRRRSLPFLMLFLVFLYALVGCTKRELSMPQVNDPLIGTWYGKGFQPLPNGNAEWLTRLRSDGTFTTHFKILDGKASGQEQIEQGIWSHEGNVYFTVTQSIDGADTDAKNPFYRDEYAIQTLTSTETTYKHIRTGQMFQTVKASAEQESLFSRDLYSLSQEDSSWIGNIATVAYFIPVLPFAIAILASAYWWRRLSSRWLFLVTAVLASLGIETLVSIAWIFWPLVGKGFITGTTGVSDVEMKEYINDQNRLAIVKGAVDLVVTVVYLWWLKTWALIFLSHNVTDKGSKH